jgi:hypothetical protein
VTRRSRIGLNEQAKYSIFWPICQDNDITKSCQK